MPFVELEGLRFHYLDIGPTEVSKSDTQIPIVFLHGFTLDHRSWLQQADYFGKDYRVIIPDSRGHGLSEAPETGYSRDQRVEDVRAIMDHLEFEKIHLVGLSMGGVTGIGFALKYQERLASLTLVDTGAAGYRVGPKIAHIDKIAREMGVDAARKKWIQVTTPWYKEDQAGIKELITTMMKEHSGAIWVDPMRGKYPRTTDLENVHRITVRTKIFVGERDRIFLPLAKELHELIPNNSLSIYENVGHMLNLEAPSKFNEELKVFLEGT